MLGSLGLQALSDSDFVWADVAADGQRLPTCDSRSVLFDQPFEARIPSQRREHRVDPQPPGREIAGL